MKKGIAAAAVCAFVLASVPVFSLGLANSSPMRANAAFSYDGAYVNGIREKTPASSLDGTVKRNGTVLSGSSFVGTGDVLTHGGNDYTVIVKGDVNGDGSVGTADFLMIRDSFLGKLELAEAKEMAADINGGGVGTADFLMVRDHYLGKHDIYPSETSSDVSSETSSDTSSESPSSHESTFSIEIGPGKDESGWSPIF